MGKQRIDQSTVSRDMRILGKPQLNARLWKSIQFFHLFLNLLIKSLFIFYNLLPLIFLYYIQPEIAFSYAYFLSKLDLFSTAIEDVWMFLSK